MLLLALGCIEYGVALEPERFADTGVPDEEDAVDRGDAEHEGEAGPEPGADRDHPRAPRQGELVISELMIDPRDRPDSEGEWVELWNRGDAWVDLEGHLLADAGVDAFELGSVVVEPGGFVVLCPEGSGCDGEYVYETWGGGFALSNTEDEVLLLAPDGALLDEVAYGEGFAIVGASVGVDPDEATVSLNDDLDHWCEQDNPGEENDWCF